MQILLAEDNDINQHLAVRILTKRGHQVTVVQDGQEAVDLLEARPGVFDLVLMDVQMPRMDGFAATAAIRAREQEQGGHIPIVAMTAHGLEEDRARCLAAGMDGYVAKPVDIQELIDVVGRLSGGAPATAAPRPPEERGAGQDAIDWNQASANLGGDEFLLGELAAIFLEACPEMLGEIRTAVEQGDGPGLLRTAHRLRGSVGNFAAKQAIACTERLEAIAATDGLPGATEALAQLEATVKDLVAALERRLGGRGA